MNLNQLESTLHEAHGKFANLKSGKNATYIPALADVNPDLFALAAVTTAGDIITVGDDKHPFAIESVSKIFSLSLAMDQHGPAVLRRKVGAEATGEPFNSVMAIELHKGKPLTPLVNAGAISTVSLIRGSSRDELWAQLSERFTMLSGHELPVMEEVYASESAANEHNRGIAWLLKSYGYLYSEPETALDTYTRMCSLGVTVLDLARMGACLAAGGTNPLTGQEVIQAANVPEILADMAMQGLYTGSGSWFYRNGLPAKSGVGGGLICVVPGKLALAAYSPPLDEDGNSVRGVEALSYIIERMALNPLIS